MFNLGFTIFRECLEASILIGIITASLSSVQNFRIYLISGIILGVCSASFAAFFAKSLLVTYALGDDILYIIIISLTIIVLIWTVVWVQDYGRLLKQKIAKFTTYSNQDTLNTEVILSFISKIGVIAVIASTIFRETVEIILFAYGMASSHKLTTTAYIISLLIGSISGVTFGYATYKGLLQIKPKYLFKIISIILTLITSALAAKLAGILNSCGLVLTGSKKLWDSSSFISNESILGKVLDILIGYNAKPTVLQVCTYILTVIFIFICVKLRNVYNKKTFLQTSVS